MSGGKNKAFMENPIGFMKKYAVCPGDVIGMYVGDKAVPMNTSGTTGTDYVYSTIDPNKSVAWLNFSKKPHGSGVNMAFIPKAEGVISVHGTYAAQLGKVKARSRIDPETYKKLASALTPLLGY